MQIHAEALDKGQQLEHIDAPIANDPNTLNPPIPLPWYQMTVPFWLWKSPQMPNALPYLQNLLYTLQYCHGLRIKPKICNRNHPWWSTKSMELLPTIDNNSTGNHCQELYETGKKLLLCIYTSSKSSVLAFPSSTTAKAFSWNPCWSNHFTWSSASLQ